MINQPAPAPLLVIDFMVYCHMLKVAYSEYRLLYDKELANRMAKAAWSMIINRGPDFLPFQEHTIVVICDQKFEQDECYWRQREIQADERMEFAWEEYIESGRGKGRIEPSSRKYKGTRDPKTEEFLDLRRIGLDYCRKYFPTFSEPGFEADDWAGAIYRISRDKPGICRDREIFISTLDRDLSQLVDDSHKVRWANTRPPRPNEHIQNRLAKEADVLYHTEYKLGEEISHPRELPYAKHLKGDMGDNLPPGSPIEYFDLCNVHWNHSIESLGTKYNDLARAVNDPNPNTQKEHLKQSLSMFMKSGIQIPNPENHYENTNELHKALH